MERDDVAHQIPFKLLNIFSGTFATNKLPPRLKEIFKRNDIVVDMSELNQDNISSSVPPPDAFTFVAEDKNGVSNVVWVLSNSAKATPAFSWPTD